MIDHSESAYHPYLLPDVPAEGEIRAATAAAGADAAGTDAAGTAGPTGSFAAVVGDDVPVSYVAWERDRVVMGWLWWNDAEDATWHVPNVFEPGMRETDGRTLSNVHPWAAELAAAHRAGQSPSGAIQALLASQADASGDLIPVQAPMRARTLRHLEQIVGLDEYRAAEIAWRVDHGVVVADPEPGVEAEQVESVARALRSERVERSEPVEQAEQAEQAEPAEQAERSEPVELAQPSEPVGRVEPVQREPKAFEPAPRKRRRFPFFWRRG